MSGWFFPKRIGLGRWREVDERDYEKPGREKGLASPHNIYLYTLNESGRVGLLEFCAMFLFQFVALLKAGWFEKRRSALRWTVAVFLSLLGGGDFRHGRLCLF